MFIKFFKIILKKFKFFIIKKLFMNLNMFIFYIISYYTIFIYIIIYIKKYK